MSLRPTVVPQLTNTQRQSVRQTVLARRFDLVGLVHNGNYQPRAKCPTCDNVLVPLEIIDGFRADPTDYTTECPKCGERFSPKLVWRPVEFVTSEIPFYCAMQVLAQLDGLEHKTPDEIKTEHEAIYHSALIHHGTLRRAFERAGKQYPYQAVPGWETKVVDYLGRLPDTVIAEVVDVSVRAVSRLRKERFIPPFSRRELAGEESGS